MDAIETSRREAAALHAAALARGADPWKPLELVLGEVERAGFEAEPRQKGATQLGNAQARYDPELGLILYTDEGTDFDRAFLIAHELGHALLGDGEGACDTDQERSSEPAPEGEERVVAHGPRQRREVQMDLFARELLLPRPFVKDLHVSKDMSAAAIAARIGATKGVVYQQLLDALLLPEAPADLASRLRKPLNQRQQVAADHRGCAYLLEAGPGTGKTQTLTARVSALLAEGVDPRRILVLTYSNRAAGELTDRIAGARGDALAAMWIGTFHSFGLDMLHAFGDRIGRTRRPTLLDRASAVELLEDELPRLGLRHHRDMKDPTTLVSDMLDAISRAQDELCDCARYASLAAAMRDAADALDGEARAAAVERAERAAEVAVFYAHYEKLKLAGNFIDFGDLVMLAVDLLENDAAAQAHYRGKYTHVLVDEYQDVNRASVRMLKGLKPDGQGLWVVGDARQSIYRFRGASSRNVALFARDFPGAEHGDLIENYRSTEEVVQLFTHLGQGMTPVRGEGDPEPQPFEPLTSVRGPSGITPELIVVRENACLAPVIADEILADVAAGGRYRDHCVLVTGNDRLAVIGRGLEALGVPVLFLGSIFERPEIKDLLCLLSLTTDPWGAGLVRVACMPEFRMDLQQVIETTTALKSLAAGGSNALLDADKAAALCPSAAAPLASLAHALSEVGYASNPWYALAGILLDRSSIAARLAAGTSAADRSQAIAVWQFMNFVKAVGAREKPAIPALLRRVRRLLRLGDDRDLRHLPAAASGIDAVRLLTIHGAKGLEFPSVHLPGLNADTMPKAAHYGRPACPPPDGMIEFARGSVTEELAISHEEEQDCLLYVATSRARDRLRLYRCSEKKDRKPRAESSYVARLAGRLTSREAAPSREPSVPADAIAVPITVPATLSLAGWRIETYRKCPRRFLYMQLLRTGGATDRTTYGLVHDIVRRVCRDIAAGPTTPSEVELERLTRAACDVPELSEHGYYADFVQLAVELVAFYGGERRTLAAASHTAAAIGVGIDIVEIDAHEILDENGSAVLWIVQTGHQRSKAEEAIDVRAAVVAAMTRMSGSRVEMLNLADRRRVTVAPKKGAEGHFQRITAAALAGIRAGSFPKLDNAGPRSCGNCPALMICDALPAGAAMVTI